MFSHAIPSAKNSVSTFCLVNYFKLIFEDSAQTLLPLDNYFSLTPPQDELNVHDIFPLY